MFRQQHLLTILFTFIIGSSGAALAQTVFEENGINVAEDGLVYYLKNRVRPETLASSIDRPDTLPLVAQNLYIIQRLAAQALEQGDIDEEEYQWLASDAANREAMDRLIDRLIEVRLEGADWEAAARERYIAKPDLYSPGEEVNVDHILVSFEDRSWQEINERVSLIETKLADGEDFNALANEYSDDPSVERNGGTLGFFGRGAMYPSFEKAAFAMQEKGELAGPILTSFGVHFIRFNDRRSGERPEFSQVAHLIKKDLIKERRTAIRQAIIDETRAELQDITLNIDDARIREKLGLSKTP
jgi:parvulin-like peptidyl-prolyl isomerase